MEYLQINKHIIIIIVDNSCHCFCLLDIKRVRKLVTKCVGVYRTEDGSGWRSSSARDRAQRDGEVGELGEVVVLRGHRRRDAPLLEPPLALHGRPRRPAEAQLPVDETPFL